MTTTAAIEMLRRASLRPTRQRVALAKILFGSGDRHITAEQLHAENISYIQRLEDLFVGNVEEDSQRRLRRLA